LDATTHDPAQFARRFGARLAQAAANASIEVEGTAVTSAIHSNPVELAPVFVPLDPLQTWVDREQQRAIPTTVQRDWTARRILIPAALDPKAPSAGMLAGLAGCSGPLSFEAIVTRDVTNLYLVAPPQQVAFYAGAWQLHYPESLTLPANDPLQELPGFPVILDLYAGSSYDRLITAPGSFWGQCCRIASMLRLDDVLLYQVVFSPVREPWQKNIAVLSHGRRSLAEAKALDEPLFAVAIRFATTREDLAGPLAALAGHFTSAGLPFQYRSRADFLRVLDPETLNEMFRHRCSYTLGQFATSSELGLFIHPPDPDVAGTVQLEILTGLPVPERLREQGMLLGVNHDRGAAVTVHYPWQKQYNAHAVMAGTSGKGKSAALANWIVSLAAQGAGILFLDPHRRTAESLVGSLGDVRDRVAYLDFDVEKKPIAYNPFEDALPEDFSRLAGDFLQTLTPLFDTEGRHQINHLLRNGLYALFVLGVNLAKLPVLYSSSSEGELLRAQVIKNVRHEMVLRFWRDEFPALGQRVAPIHNRLESLLFDEQMLRTFSQHENKLDFSSFMRDGKVVIVALPSEWEAARIVGGFFIGQCKHLAMRRGPTDARFFLVVDEFHRFGGAAFHEILDQTTKGRLSLWLAHQTTSQIPPELKKTIQGIDNFVFGINDDDAKHYASLLGGKVSPETLKSQPTGSVYARIGGDIVNFTCPPPLVPDPDVAAEIISASRARYYEAGPAQPVVAARRLRIIETFE